jgi:hypothetical protein
MDQQSGSPRLESQVYHIWRRGNLDWNLSFSMSVLDKYTLITQMQRGPTARIA